MVSYIIISSINYCWPWTIASVSSSSNVPTSSVLTVNSLNVPTHGHVSCSRHCTSITNEMIQYISLYSADPPPTIAAYCPTPKSSWDDVLASSIPSYAQSIMPPWSQTRCWRFFSLLESFCQASFASPLALKHLQDFIYYTYTFYTEILEEHTLHPFQAGWLKAPTDYQAFPNNMHHGSSWAWEVQYDG